MGACPPDPSEGRRTTWSLYPFGPIAFFTHMIEGGQSGLRHRLDDKKCVKQWLGHCNCPPNTVALALKQSQCTLFRLRSCPNSVVCGVWYKARFGLCSSCTKPRSSENFLVLAWPLGAATAAGPRCESSCVMTRWSAGSKASLLATLTCSTAGCLVASWQLGERVYPDFLGIQTTSTNFDSNFRHQMQNH